MCQAKPGLRCVNHLGKQIVKEREKIHGIDEAIIRIRESQLRSVDGRGSRVQQDELAQLEHYRSVVGAEIRQLKREYDMTQTGRGILRDQLKNAVSNGDMKTSRLIEQKITQAEHNHAQATKMTDNQTAGLHAFQEALKRNPSLTKPSNKAQESWQNATKALNVLNTTTDGSHADLISTIERDNSESVLYRRMASEIALRDDQYEPGIYGVFHGYDGSIYLSRVEDDDSTLGTTMFENGITTTSINEYDQQRVLVEKGRDGVISTTAHHKHSNPVVKGFERMGIVSKRILSETTPEQRKKLALMAKTTFERMFVANNQGTRIETANEIFQSALRPRSAEGKELKKTLVRAWRYAMFSPNADNR